ncbi:hypothetical protein CVT24_011879 [Panaeolus cyanescens]|uniref:Uncharacterized protein n=1 Tax=Panaeolus cyanescens TaxID=181874 RepID=A0A409YNL8_9AGAR|nr:hypothetical protein CVT24_011879 [Panaeolus cyanescens]
MVIELSSPSMDVQTEPIEENVSQHEIHYPPFPTPPEGVHVIPFKDFKQAGIEIFSEDGIERDGRGVPTISLRIRHETDVCKTDSARADGQDSTPTTGKKKKKGKRINENQNTDQPGNVDPPAIDHIQRAKEKKLEMLKQFARRHWYEIWADAPSAPQIESIWQPQTFGKGVPGHTSEHKFLTFGTRYALKPFTTNVLSLPQIRIFIGLLGQTPVWIRTDLQQESDDNVSDDEEEFEAQTRRKTSPPQPAPNPTKTSYSDSDSENIDDEPGPAFDDQPVEENEAEQEAKQPPRPRNPIKRVLPRTPYALYNVEPILISSAEEVAPLLARASRAKAAHLSAFLFHPGPILQTRVLLSSHLRIEGLVFTPSFLRDIPRLMLFWIEYLLRTRAVKEVERELRGAREIALKAVEELIRTGVVCKRLPDRVGKGMKGFFGVRWRDEDEEEKNENVKRFEEVLKAENVQFVGVEDLPETVPNLGPLAAVTEERLANVKQDSEVIVQETKVTEATHESDGEGFAVSSTDAATNEPGLATEASDQNPNPESNYPSFSIPVDEEEPQDIPKWGEPTEVKTDLAAWLDTPTQPLFQLMGPTVFPLKFEAGGPGDGLGPWTWPVPPGSMVDEIAKAASTPIPIQTKKRAFVERSMRRVKSIHLPGALSPPEKAVTGYVSKGVESQIVERLARIVLEPWLDWDPEGKVEPIWSKPRVQRPPADTGKVDNEDDEQKDDQPVQHDPEKDEIVLLVEPDILQTVFVGMGIAGTWVQLVRVPSSPLAPSSGPARGGARGRGQGRGRGHGRGGAGSGGQGGSEPRKQLTWWYAEDVYMAIPSYWLLGEDIVVPEDEAETQD